MGKASLLAIGVILTAAAQEQATFDVVSMKHVGDQQSNSVQVGPGAFRSNMRGFQYTPTSLSCRLTLLSILTEAYGVKSFQVQGPDWLDQEVYEISARMADGTPKQTARLMLQTALADRMGLKLRREQKEFPVLLMVTIPGGKKLEEVVPTPKQFGYNMSMDSLEADPGMPLSALTYNLSQAAGRPVLDETGLKGYYKVKLQWNADPAPTEGAVVRLGTSSGIISALSQIGLKLEPAKRMLANLVVEKVNKEPAEN